MRKEAILEVTHETDSQYLERVTYRRTHAGEESLILQFRLGPRQETVLLNSDDIEAVLAPLYEGKKLDVRFEQQGC